jgi:hypothetical protein
LLVLVLVFLLLPAIALYRKRERAGALLPPAARNPDDAAQWSSI